MADLLAPLSSTKNTDQLEQRPLEHLRVSASPHKASQPTVSGASIDNYVYSTTTTLSPQLRLRRLQHYHQPILTTYPDSLNLITTQHQVHAKVHGPTQPASYATASFVCSETTSTLPPRHYLLDTSLDTTSSIPFDTTSSTLPPRHHLLDTTYKPSSTAPAVR